MNLQAPSPLNRFHEAHVRLLADSYQILFKRELLPVAVEQSLSQSLFEANFALLSHNDHNDPLFNYANQTAMKLFEMSWSELIGMPSRFSAEPVNRRERESLLAQVADKGYISDYSGIRIAKSGARFMIEQAVVWNIRDKRGQYHGQAAMFNHWRVLS